MVRWRLCRVVFCCAPTTAEDEDEKDSAQHTTKSSDAGAVICGRRRKRRFLNARAEEPHQRGSPRASGDSKRAASCFSRPQQQPAAPLAAPGASDPQSSSAGNVVGASASPRDGGPVSESVGVLGPTSSAPLSQLRPLHPLSPLPPLAADDDGDVFYDAKANFSRSSSSSSVASLAEAGGGAFGGAEERKAAAAAGPKESFSADSSSPYAFARGLEPPVQVRVLQLVCVQGETRPTSRQGVQRGSAFKGRN